MKICYLGDAPSLHLRKFVNYFVDQGNEVHIISMRSAKYDNAAVYPMPKRVGFDHLDYLLSVFWLRKVLRTITPDILHTHYLTSYGLLGALSGFHPLIVSTWGTDLLITPKKSFIFRSLLRYTLRKADLVTDVASFMNEALIKFGADPVKIITSPMGVDTEIFRHRERKYSKRAISILSMRTLVENSNIETIIKSMQILRSKGIESRLLIANSGRLQQNLRRLTNDLKLNDVIDFIGVIDHSQTIEYFATADIYVSITSSDGASVALLEAMACGVFPIVSNIPANREWIKNGENGFIIPLKDTHALAKKITLAVQDQRLREKAAEINWRIINERAELQKNMRPIERQYKSLLSQKFDTKYLFPDKHK